MIRVLFDENLSEHSAEGFNRLQYPLANGIEVTSIAKEFCKGIDDGDWIPEWSLSSGIFLTQDLKILKTKKQVYLLEKHRMGGFFIKSPKGYDYWDTMELIVKYWPKIVKVMQTTEGSYVYFVTPKRMIKG